MPKISSPEKLAAIAEENALFLRHLRQTGNATLAAGMAKRDRCTFAARRRADRAFDERCQAAIAFARAALNRKGAAPAKGSGVMQAAGGEYMIGTNRTRGLQVRLARPGHVTAEGERVFLAHLSVTANIQLAAEVIGVDPRAFYKRRRNSEAFANAMREALIQGYETVEMALLGATLRGLAPGAGRPGTAEEVPVPTPQTTIGEALALPQGL